MIPDYPSSVQREYPSAEFTVTCANSGCENEGVPIVLNLDPTEPIAICGPCGSDISASATLVLDSTVG